MRPRRNARYALLALCAAGLTVSACATAPTSATSSPAKLDPSYGKMAPIPNPTEEDKRQAPRSAPRPAEASPRPSAAAPAKPAPAAPKTAASPGRDPAKAQLLRAQGLEQLNRGAINKAQDLLRQALQLDPGNTLIQRDLDRATRIGRAVQAKP
jgi:hypothetical protein